MKNLRIDMCAPLTSPWNKRLTELLYLEVMKSKGEDVNQGKGEWDDLPERSQHYFEDLIVSQLRCAKQAWMEARPQEKEDGTLETAQEAEERTTKRAEAKEASNRGRTRHRQVRKTHDLWQG